VGVDPSPALLRAWGLDDDVAGLERFTRTVVDTLAGEVAAIKPQSAFFERFGSRGIALLERCLADIRAGGALAVLDAKRGDIGSTSAAYAAAYLHPAGPLFADALTVSPYLGYGALRPFVDAARASGAGVFVLALTSNPEGAVVQRAVTPSGRSVAEEVLAAVAADNAGASPLGSVGVVVGATLPETGVDLRAVNGPVLAPGLGAQGAAPADLARLFADVRDRVLPSSSRELLGHGPDAGALRAGARAAVGTCRAALS
jgi:orotidine-5'-phosphate decarboxylase